MLYSLLFSLLFNKCEEGDAQYADKMQPEKQDISASERATIQVRSALCM